MAKDESKKLIITISTIIIIIILGAGMWKYSSPIANREKLDVSGSGKVVKAPDQAILYIYAETRGETVVKSQFDNSEIINRVITSLKNNGIDEAEIETYSYSVTPEYFYPENEEPRIIGYKTVQGLKVKTTDLAKVGSLLEISAQAGANRFDNIDFTLTDAKLEEAKNEAITIAANNAAKKAQTLAKSNGVNLKKPLSIIASTSDITPYRYDIAKGETSGVAIPSRSIEVTASIQITYEI